MIVDRSGQQLLARAHDLARAELRELAAGAIRVEESFDLHGARRDQVETQLLAFLLAARRNLRRCVLVVHGHGGRAGTNAGDARRHEAALRIEVRHALVGPLSGLVLAAASAMPKDGGRGSTYVMVRT